MNTAVNNGPEGLPRASAALEQRLARAPGLSSGDAAAAVVTAAERVQGVMDLRAILLASSPAGLVS